MQAGFRIEPWQNVYIMLGTSAAALTGLLFVAVSLQAQAIVRDPVLRVRASANTTMTVMLIVNSAAIVVPQAVVAIGIELAAIAIVYISWAVHRIIRITNLGRRTPVRALVSVSINTLGILAGLCLVLRSEAGMYIATIQFLAILAWVVFNAWSLLLDANIGQDSARTFT